MRVSSLADRPRLQLRLQERDRLQAHWTDRCDYVEPCLFSLSNAAAAAAALACCMQCRYAVYAVAFAVDGRIS